MRVRRRLRPEAKKSSGGVLMMALITVMSVGMLMAAYLSHSSALTRRQAHSIELKQSFYLAEAGLAEAFAGLAIGKTGNVGSEAAPAVFGQGLFWVEATELVDDQVQLDCTAMVGQTRAELSLVAERGEVNIASLGIFGGDGIEAQPGTVIDAYDSEEGEYTDRESGGLARIGTNGTITLTGTELLPTVLVADVMAGPASSVDVGENVLILGETGTAQSETELPVVTAPTHPVDQGIVHAAETPLVIPEGSRGLERLEVGKNAEVVIQGPAEVLIEQLVVQTGGSLELDTRGGRIELYVDEELSMNRGSSLVTSGQDPSAVSIQVVGELAAPATFAAAAEFHGVIYAPESELRIANGFNVYGALVGKTLTFTGAASLHYDARLQRLAEDLSLPRIVSWRILELSTDSDLLGNGDDPFQLLGVDRASLNVPADSHEDQPLSITYLDAGSTLQVYDGMESGFDWTDVSVPVTVTRDGQPVASRGSAAPADPALALALKLDHLIDTVAVSADLKTSLVAAAPLPDQALLKAIDDPNALTSAHLKAVLQATPGLDDSVLLAAIADDTLTSRHMTQVLTANAPISNAVRNAVSTRSSVVMDAGDLMTIMMMPIK